MQFSYEIKVGVVVLIGMCLLAAAVFIIGDIQLFNKRYNMTVSFNHVDGLLEGAKVTYSGVKVGKIERIDIIGGHVKVKISVAEKIKIPKCSKFMIDTAGIMGEKYLGIDMDACDIEKPESKVFYADGNEVTGIDPLRLSKLFSEGEGIMTKLRGSIDNVNKIIGDEKVIDSTKQMVINAYEVSLSAKNFMNSLEDRIDGLQDNVEDLIKNFSDAGGALAAIIKDNRVNITELIQNYKDAGAEITDLISDNRKNITDLISNFKKVGDNLNKMVIKIDDDGNTAEKIKEMLENFRKTSKNVESATNSVNNIFKDGSVETELKSSIKSVSNVVKKADTFLTSFKNTSVKMLYTLRGDDKKREAHNDMAIKINSGGDKSFLVGVRDIGNDNKFDLQFCQNGTGKLSKRMGIIKSKVGIGVDYKWKKNVLYSVDLIDTNKTQVETTSTYQFKDNISLISKVENALKKKERNYNVGIQYAF